jgi:hypothetical protein
MTITRFTGEPRADHDAGAAIRVGEGQNIQREQSRWGTILVFYMRALAGVWICQGLSEWAKVMLPGDLSLAYLPSGTAVAAVMFFATADLVAAVGLWLATPWGGALWLFAASSQIFVVVALPNFYSPLWAIADFALILVYFVLTWRAGHSSEPYYRRGR